MLNKYVFPILTAMLLTVAGATTAMAGPGNGNGNGDGSGDSGGTSTLSKVEGDHLLFMREEEKLARGSYLTLHDLWGNLIFSNIATAEQKHMDALKVLLDKYNLPDPILEEGLFADPDLQILYDGLMAFGEQSELNGLIVGAMIEETDIYDLQHAIDDTEHEDINSTYESLMCGSRNHLRAFIRQLEAVFYVYVPLGEENGGLDAEEFWDIAHSEMERDCGGNTKGNGKKGKK
jgi:hypothetical protein